MSPVRGTDAHPILEVEALHEDTSRNVPPTPKSVAYLRATSRTPHKEIDQSADEMRKQNDQNPNNLFVVLIAFLGRAIDEHPNPEDRAEQTNDQKQRTKHQFKEAKKAKHGIPFG